MQSYDSLFYPRSIAVIGAPSDDEKAQFLRYLMDMGYDGEVYPVNPNADTILGLTAYDSISAVPETVDLAIVKVPRTIVPDVIEECADAGVSFAHIFTGGFSEASDEIGQELSDSLSEIVDESDIRVIGPNCVGIFSPGGRVPFLEGLIPEVGPIGVVSQSGGLATDVCRQGQMHGLRFSKVVTVGNMLDVNHVEMLEHLYQDDTTEIVVAYLEGVQSANEGRELFELFDEYAAETPTIVLKGGRSETGARAASSHTGALAGDYSIWRSVFEQTGVIGVTDFDELIDTAAAAMYWEQTPSRSLGIIGHGGGLSVTAVDKAADVNLDIPELSPEVVAEFQDLNISTEIATVENPIDVPDILAGDDDLDKTRELVQRVILIPTHDDAIDGLLLYLNIQNIQGYGTGPEVFHAVIDGVVSAGEEIDGEIPFGVILRSNEEPDIVDLFQDGRERLLDIDVPVFNDLDGALEATANLAGTTE